MHNSHFSRPESTDGTWEAQPEQTSMGRFKAIASELLVVAALGATLFGAGSSAKPTDDGKAPAVKTEK